MVKRPGLGKRKRVTLPQIEASEQSEQQDELPDTQASVSDPGDTATQATQAEDTDDMDEASQDSQSHGRYKKKRLVRMDMDRKEAAWSTQARAMGMEGEFH